MSSHFVRLCTLALVASIAIAGEALAHKTGSWDILPDSTATQSGMKLQQAPPDTARRMPTRDTARGRKLFASKGCVACHSVNGIGGDAAPSLDAHTARRHMNPFDFAAGMWRGAAAMIALQKEALGAQIGFTGDELADIIAFLGNEEEQHRFSEADIPAGVMSVMRQARHVPAGGSAQVGEFLHKANHGPN